MGRDESPMLDLVTVVFAPAVFWLVYHDHKDRHKPEPMSALGLALLSGVAAGFVCLRVWRMRLIRRLQRRQLADTGGPR